MNERLWSPQMRKWVRDADRHGHSVGFYKSRPDRRVGGAGGGSQTPNQGTVIGTLVNDDSTIFLMSDDFFYMLSPGA
jgi:hypothetical protein